MEQTTTTKKFFSELRSSLETYIHNRWQLVKLELTHKLSAITTIILTTIGVLFCLVFILFFLGMMLGHLFAKWTNSLGGGFAIVTGIYLLILLVIWFCRHAIINKISDVGTKLFFSKKESKEYKNDNPKTDKQFTGTEAGNATA